MSLEAIKTIVAAETEAEKQHADALAEAKRIVAAAETAGRDEVQKAKETAQMQVQALHREAEAKGAEATAKTAGEGLDQCRNLEKEAVPRMDKAVAIIVERVVNAEWQL